MLHSYAGVVGIQAAVGLGKRAGRADGGSGDGEGEGKGKGQGGVVKLVFLSANVPKVGESHFEQIMGWFMGQGITPPSWVEVGEVRYSLFQIQNESEGRGALQVRSANTPI